ncbi:MAG: guanine deaminase [Candidatus Nanopelagicales bacterium]|nr:guanine deaminase [Candidatus Nanopelagicales bacterium]
MTTIHRGRIFHVAGSPTVHEAAQHLAYFDDGGLAVDDAGTIVWCGHWADRPIELADAEVVTYAGCFLMPGFVDTHMHFPQVNCGDSYGGGQLLEWLTQCIFPSEARFADPNYARQAAAEWCDRMITAGTTTGLIFGSQFPTAQDALFEAARVRGLRIIAGRTIMTVGPESAGPLLTSERDAIEFTRNEIEKWHPKTDAERSSALQQVAIVPRFSLSVTTTTLAGLGELYDEYRAKGVYFTSHLNENNRPGTGEIDSVKRLYEVDAYLDTYDGRFLPGSKHGGSSLLGRRSVMAHGVHCQDRELARMAETGTSIAHCPTSQLFLGSGTMPWTRTVDWGVTVAIGSDFSAGDEWFIPQVLNAAFKVHISEPGDAGLSLHPAALLFLGTLAGARALDLEDRIGNFDVGKEADFVVVDPSRWDQYGNTLRWGARPTDPELERDALLFTTIMAMREPTLTHTFVRGRRLVTADRGA